MEVIYLLIPISLALVAVIAWFFLWAVRSGQFEDMEGPAYRILMEDDELAPPQNRFQDEDVSAKSDGGLTANGKDRPDGREAPEQGAGQG